MNKYYAGIGSRSAPFEILYLMRIIAHRLSRIGYKLRSGGAKGSDKAFESGAGGNAEIYLSSDAENWAFEMAEKTLPTDRKNFSTWTPYIKGLIARNMMQILGKNGDSPVDFVVCWAPSTFYKDSSSGGTGYAIRLALSLGVKVYNLYDVEQQKEFLRFLEVLEMKWNG